MKFKILNERKKTNNKDYYSGISGETYEPVEPINIPEKPKFVNENGLGEILIGCPNCGYLFKKEDRCPQCGQLIDYSVEVKETGRKWSNNKKLNRFLQNIEGDLVSTMDIDEIKRYMKDYPREKDYNIAQYGNLLVYYGDVEDVAKECGYSQSTLSKIDVWDWYLRAVGSVARGLVNETEA